MSFLIHLSRWTPWNQCNRSTVLIWKVYNIILSRLMTKPTKWQCAQRRLRSAWASAQSDQSLRCLCMKKPWVLSYPLRTQRRLWSDWADAQADLSLRCVVSAWRNLGSLVIHWEHSEDSDQTERMPRLIWVVAGRTVILLVLSWGGSY